MVNKTTRRKNFVWDGTTDREHAVTDDCTDIATAAGVAVGGSRLDVGWGC